MIEGDSRRWQWASLALIATVALVLLIRYPFFRSPATPGEKLPRISLRADATPPRPVAFEAFLQAWDRSKNGDSPYDRSGTPQSPVLDDSLAVRYPPGLIAAVGLLPNSPGRAWQLFSALSILLFAGALAVGARYSTRPLFLTLLLGLSVSWKGILETLDHGQLELMIFGLAILGGSQIRQRPLLAGLLLGILPWLKFPWILLLMAGLLLLTAGRLALHQKSAKAARLFFSGFAFSSLLVGAAIPSLVFGTDRARELMREWIQLLIEQPVTALFSSEINQSAWASIIRWTGVEPLVAGALVFLLLGLLLGALVSRPVELGPIRLQQEHRAEPLRWLSPWLVFIQLVNPFAWRWGSVFLVGMPLASIRGRETTGKARVILWGIAIALSLVQTNPIAQLLGYPHWSDLQGMGIGTALWAVFLFLSL
jgi:hypothetical protein